MARKLPKHGHHHSGEMADEVLLGDGLAVWVQYESACRGLSESPTSGRSDNETGAAARIIAGSTASTDTVADDELYLAVTRLAKANLWTFSKSQAQDDATSVKRKTYVRAWIYDVLRDLATVRSRVVKIESDEGQTRRGDQFSKWTIWLSLALLAVGVLFIALQYFVAWDWPSAEGTADHTSNVGRALGLFAELSGALVVVAALALMAVLVERRFASIDADLERRRAGLREALALHAHFETEAHHRLQARVHENEEWRRGFDRYSSDSVPPGLDMVMRDLSGAISPGMRLTQIRAFESSWSRAYVRGSLFDACNLQGANFRRADLTDSRFVQGSLAYADMEDCGLRDVWFEGTDLSGVDLASAIDVDQCRFVDAIFWNREAGRESAITPFSWWHNNRLTLPLGGTSQWGARPLNPHLIMVKRGIANLDLEMLDKHIDGIGNVGPVFGPQKEAFTIFREWLANSTTRSTHDSSAFDETAAAAFTWASLKPETLDPEFPAIEMMICRSIVQRISGSLPTDKLSAEDEWLEGAVDRSRYDWDRGFGRYWDLAANPAVPRPNDWEPSEGPVISTEAMWRLATAVTEVKALCSQG